MVKDLCTWNMKDLRVAHPRNLKSWAICQVHKSGSGIIANDRLNELSRLFAEVLSKTGITVESQAEIQFIDFNGHDESIVDKSIRAMKGRKFQIVLVILPKEDSLLYRLVKFYGDVKHGLSTVCVDRPNFDKLKSSVPVFANIALKFNLKLGGVNQTLDGHDLGIIQYENTMIVGLGMTHPSSGSSSAAPTVAAMVATVDNTLGQWPGTLRVQTGSEEIIQDLGPMLRSRLILWRQAHSGKSPENIIVYRNGVSEGQYNEVRTNEIPRLKDGCTDLYTPAKVKNGLPRFTVIVVGKRHNTRFYALPSDLASAKKPASESTPEKATPNQKGGPTPQTPKDGGKGKSKLQSPKNGFRSGQKSQAQKEGGKDGPKTLAPTDGNKPSFNPKNGTIVDECLADPDLGFGMWEFYLTSHKANKGTVRPAHYVVICDEIWGAKDLKMAPNDRAKIIQDLTHNMCYLWGRSTTSVSYAPAAYYADKLCARARHYLKGYYEPSSDAPAATDDTGKGQREPTKKQEDLVQIHHDLKDTMFYI